VAAFGVQLKLVEAESPDSEKQEASCAATVLGLRGATKAGRQPNVGKGHGFRSKETTICDAATFPLSPWRVDI